MNVLVVLAVILFILMKIIGGEKGTRSFVSLFLNVGIVFLTIILLAHQVHPAPVTLAACVVISAINLFYINEVNPKTKTAFLATVLTSAILLFFIWFIQRRSLIQGFGEEEIEELSTFSLYVGIDYRQIGISTVMMGAIGAIADTSISIASSMNEVFIHHPFITRLNLFKSGMTIGKDILGTTTNTLFFAFIGGYLALMLWFNDLNYSFSEIINSKVFNSEVISILVIGTGAILIIPITAGLLALKLVKEEQK